MIGRIDLSHYEEFEAESAREVEAQGRNEKLKILTAEWFTEANRGKYSYHFKWLGRPIIQYPQDVVAVQELIWSVRPDVVIETGIAHGGSLVLTASILAMLDYADAAAEGGVLDPAAPRRRVIGIDIDIRAHNREALERHPLAPRIELVQGSSIDRATVSQVHARVQALAPGGRVLVFLDSNHTADHVLQELDAYAGLVTPGSYCVVFDTIIEHLPGCFPDRDWDPGNSPKTAVDQWLQNHPEFSIDETIERKLLITVAPGGFLKRAAR
jgi:cephalosporin hydroxylase